MSGLPGYETVNMPLFGTFVSMTLNLGIPPALLFIISQLLIYALVFCAGCLLRGYWAGVLALMTAGLFEAGRAVTYDVEQSFYSFFLLLVMALLHLKRRENTLKNNLLAGLAVGASMLVRSPLFLFPPVLILCDWLYGERTRAFVRRSLVFMAASYVLLVPWNILNHSLTGRFTLFDAHSAKSNVITGALGSVYTMEGDARKLAGIGSDDSAFVFYVRKAAENPLFFILTVLRRLWHIFLFNPLLFGLLLLALLVNRDRDRRLIFGLPIFFIAIHSLLSVDKRYFYPMLYVLPPIIAASLLPRRLIKSPGSCVFAEKTTVLFFLLSFCAVLSIEALMIVYPYRAAQNSAGNEAFVRTLDRFPNDRALQEMKCRRMLDSCDYPGYYKCLVGYSEKFDDLFYRYFLSIMAARSSSELAPPVGKNRELWRCLTAKMFREFELGDKTSAIASFRQISEIHNAAWHMLRGTPYKRDRELAAGISRDTEYFWRRHARDILLMWPLERRVKILSRLEKKFSLPGELKELGNSSGVPCK